MGKFNLQKSPVHSSCTAAVHVRERTGGCTVVLFLSHEALPYMSGRKLPNISESIREKGWINFNLPYMYGRSVPSFQILGTQFLILWYLHLIYPLFIDILIQLLSWFDSIQNWIRIKAESYHDINKQWFIVNIEYQYLYKKLDIGNENLLQKLVLGKSTLNQSGTLPYIIENFCIRLLIPDWEKKGHVTMSQKSNYYPFGLWWIQNIIAASRWEFPQVYLFFLEFLIQKLKKYPLCKKICRWVSC